ncbi:Uncharacterized protein GBIM_17742, partial [Gryllus bimaculatus]
MQNLKMKYCISVYMCVCVIISEGWTAEITRKNRTDSRGHVFNVDCPDFGEVDHGVVTRIDANIPALRIECDDGYDLIGRPKILCQSGQWENIPRPQCAKRCNPPPFIRYGEVRIDSRTEESTFFRKGSLVTYSCAAGFSLVPPNSRIRECRDGLWTGIQGTCAVRRLGRVVARRQPACRRPPPAPPRAPTRPAAAATQDEDDDDAAVAAALPPPPAPRADDPNA